MTSRPKIVSFMPKRVLERSFTTVYLSGENFQTGATLAFGAIAPALTVLSSNRASFLLPNTVLADTHDVVLTNPDGGRSPVFEFEVDPIKSARDGYIDKIIDQRVQPLPPPLQTRTDSQWVEATNQFTSTLPDEPQGNWKNASGPTRGGRWAWAEDVIITEIEFMADGVEPAAGRANDSAFYKVRKDGSRMRVLGLDGIRSNDEFIEYEGAAFRLAQGEEIQLITTGATLAMKASIAVRIDRPYL